PWHWHEDCGSVWCFFGPVEPRGAITRSVRPNFVTEVKTMTLPLQITFHNLSRSEPIEEKVRERAAHLEEFSEHILGCRVVIDVPHRNHQHGNHYQVRIALTVPGEVIVVNHESETHRDIHAVIRDAFNAAVRQLEDYVRRRRRLVKAHEPAPHARVRALFPA